jgi:thiosulfate dehydrogenase [quinone] large subunit
LTFAYAGLQKVADPGFLRPGASTYIGTQLQSFAAHSPITFLINWLALPFPQVTGVAVIATELLIGVLVLLGLATRWAAAAGALVSFTFFLTASWTVQPYFLGSDSIYAVAWVTLAIVGDQGVFTARRLLFHDSAARAGDSADPARRRMLLELGAGAVALVWLLAVLPRTRSSTPAPSPTGTRIGSIADIQARGSLTFTDPESGDSAVALRLTNGSVVAFDSVCTHAGCVVDYDPSRQLLVCPCHRAEFDPARAAAVVAGPAPAPLASIKVQVAPDGGIYTG